MFKFLDTLNPNMFLLETKFGTIPKYERGGNYLIGFEKKKDIMRLSDFFSITYSDAELIYEDWLMSKPVYVRIKNTTTEYTYIPKIPVAHTTV